VRVAHQLRTALFTNKPPAGDALRAGLDILRSADLRETLSAITQPALVLHGENDKVTPVGAGRALAEALPRAKLATLAACGHAPFLSATERVAGLIVGFAGE
jgi:pimeloyl-[acyl-carrier protein] methyl ester esterase